MTFRRTFAARNRVSAGLALAVCLVLAGLFVQSLGAQGPPAMQPFFNRTLSVDIAASPISETDSVTASAMLDGRRSWFFTLQNGAPDSPAPDVTNATIAVDSDTLSPSLFPGISGFPFEKSAPMLAGCQPPSSTPCQLNVGDLSNTNVTVSNVQLGYNAARHVDPLTIAAGGGDQTVEVHVTVTHGRYSTPSLQIYVQVAGNVTSDAGPSNLVAGQTLSPLSLGNWFLHGASVNVEYVFTATVHFDTAGIHKPAVRVSVSPLDGNDPEFVTGPVTLSDPDVDLHATYSINETRDWTRIQDTFWEARFAALEPPCGFTVRNTNENGPESLRQAISCANSTPGPDTITFDIPGAGVHTIQAMTALPLITDAVVIDGYTQPGAQTNSSAMADNAVLLIELNGQSLPAPANGLVLTSSASGSTIRGLVINRASAIDTVSAGCTNEEPCGGNGISLQSSSSNIIEGNFLGPDATGMNGFSASNFLGVGIDGASANNRIGGASPASRNLLSGNMGTGVGIRSASATGNQIVGNLIGPRADGIAPIPAGSMALNRVGVILNDAGDNVIGGTTAAERNVISGNGGTGVVVKRAGAAGNRIRGNYIGVDVHGTSALPNGGGGVIVGAFADGGPVAAGPGNTIGGTPAGAGNVISGNSANGIAVQFGSSGTIIQGNYIGTNAAGTGALANSGHGVAVSNSPNNTIGGATAGARNVISSNTLNGVIVQFGATATLIQGNYVGTDAAGTGALGNGGPGIAVDSSPNATIGGTTAAAQNVIARNGAEGVVVRNGATGALIQGNSIGVDANGDNLPNSFSGVRIDNAPGATVAGNTIVSAQSGVSVGGTGPVSNVSIVGNPRIEALDGLPAIGMTSPASIGDITIDGNTLIKGGPAPSTAVFVSSPNNHDISVSENASISGGGNGVNFSGSTNTNISVVKNIAIHGGGGAGVGVGGGTGTVLNERVTLSRNGSIAGFTRGIGVGSPGAATVTNRDIEVTDNGSVAAVGPNSNGIGIGSSQGGVVNLGVTVRNNGSSSPVSGTIAGIAVSSPPNVSPSSAEQVTIADNVVTGGLRGINISGVGQGNVVANNDVSGASQAGIHMTGMNQVAVGGNRVHDNGGAGIIVRPSATGSRLSQNSISSNGGLGIDLGADFVTPNDGCDADTGANNLQNFPVIGFAARFTGGTRLKGTLESAPNATFTLEFFANSVGDPSGFGEGEQFIGSAVVATDSQCRAAFDVVLGPIAAGQVVAATATDTAGNTSEFSPWVAPVTDLDPPRVACVESVNPSGENVPRAQDQNEDGFYEVSGSDAGTFTLTLGTFTLSNGETIKLTQTPGRSGVSLVGAMGPLQIRHFQVGPDDPTITATDAAGNTSIVTCLVPPPPK